MSVFARRRKRREERRVSYTASQSTTKMLLQTEDVAAPFFSLSTGMAASAAAGSFITFELVCVCTTNDRACVCLAIASSTTSLQKDCICREIYRQERTHHTAASCVR